MPHSEKSLFQLVSFRIALWAPISIAILFSVYIFITSDLTFQTGFVGLNNAWDIFKIPLALFSLVFPSVALVAANHRSIQSKKQIDLTQKNIELSIKQNTLKNYYESIHEFESYLDSCNLQLSFIYKNKRIMYRKFFKHNSPNLVEVLINKNVLLDLKNQYQTSVDNILNDLVQKRTENNEESEKALLNLYSSLKDNWLHNYGLEMTYDPLKNSNDSFSEAINKFTNEFYTLLNYCMKYNPLDMEPRTPELDSFSNSESWISFKGKFDKDIGEINFSSLFTSSMDFMFKH